MIAFERQVGLAQQETSFIGFWPVRFRSIMTMDGQKTVKEIVVSSKLSWPIYIPAPRLILRWTKSDDFEPFSVAIANLEPKRLDFPQDLLNSAMTTGSLLGVGSRLLEIIGERL